MGSTGSIGKITYNGSMTAYLTWRNKDNKEDRSTDNDPQQSGYLIINAVTSSSITVNMSTYGLWGGNINEYFLFEL